MKRRQLLRTALLAPLTAIPLSLPSPASGTRPAACPEAGNRYLEDEWQVIIEEELSRALAEERLRNGQWEMAEYEVRWIPHPNLVNVWPPTSVN